MPRPNESAPMPSLEKSTPRSSAEKYFELLKKRGDLRRALRGVDEIGAEERMELLKEGGAGELFKVLKAQRKPKEGEEIKKPSQRLSERLQMSGPEQNNLEAIDNEIKALASNLEVKDEISKIRHERVLSSKETHKVSIEYRALYGILDELAARDYAILRSKIKTAKNRDALKDNAQLRKVVEDRLCRLVESPETARAARLAELEQYRYQLIETRFAMTPSRRKIAEKVRNLWARGEAVLLTGPTGTGKTEFFSYLTRMLYGRPLSSLLRSSPMTTPSEIFGKAKVKATPEGGTDMIFLPGVYVRAIDNGMPFIIDEINILETKMRFSFKEYYNRVAGDSVVIQEDSGEPHTIQEGFVIGATANVKGAKYKERFELDPAESRVFASRKVDYSPKEEAYDVLLATLQNKNGEIRMARKDASETLKRLLEAVELTQQAFEGKQTQFYAEGAGAKKTPAALEKAVLDLGRIRKIISGWSVEEARGKKFRDFLEDELLAVIQTEDYPEKDRRLLIQIFVTKGFFNGRSARELGIPGLDEVKLKAWGWKDEKDTVHETELLTANQVAELDPFGLRAIRAERSADDFLDPPGKSGKEKGEILGMLKALDLSKLPDGVRAMLEKKRSATLDVEVANLQEAKDILGADNVYGSEAVKATWDRDLAPHEIPPIPYSREQLESAKKMNMMLVLRVDKDKDGMSLTGKRMNEIIQPKLTATNNGKLLLGVDWYASESFFTTTTPKLEWKLVTRDLLPNSTNLDYIDETELLRDTLAQQPCLTQAEQDAIAESDDVTLARLKLAASSTVEAVWKPAAQELTKLKMNRNHRRSFVDVVFDHSTMLEKGERLFNGSAIYDRTSDLTSDGGLVRAGNADSDGVRVVGWYPRYRDDGIGVSFSR